MAEPKFNCDIVLIMAAVSFRIRHQMHRFSACDGRVWRQNASSSSNQISPANRWCCGLSIIKGEHKLYMHNSHERKALNQLLWKMLYIYVLIAWSWCIYTWKYFIRHSKMRTNLSHYLITCSYASFYDNICTVPS